ncbi:MAG TPA: multicopper oxidase family protein [Pirellulales bacterium]|jgi:FtsP/CotA-like multicopper oxidase with cupredoxin domain|nr:multicopper oxidase family protein [Pirellulales bacterium]
MPPAERAPSETEPSRRDFLRIATLGAAAGVPAIWMLSGCSGPPAADASKNEDGVREYRLDIAGREAAPDGRSRPIFCFNGQLPGPLIRAKLGDTLRVKVHNQLDVPSSVHWHGLHQPDTWRMDGVANVSAPPIPAGEEFVYEFRATPVGTHWYHSHTGVQYGDGLFGPLIVDEEEPPFRYDREEVLLLNDWFLKSSEEILADLLKPGERAGNDAPAPDAAAGAKEPAKSMGKTAADGAKTMPPDGKEADGMAGMAGKPDVGDVPFESVLFNGHGRFDPDNDAPRTTLVVRPGEIVRLRLINGSTTYALRFQIDSHRLTVVAADGSPIVPVEVDNLTIHIGERYDVLLTADQSGLAWIRAATLDGQEGRAVLRYRHTEPGEPAAEAAPWGKQELKPAEIRSTTAATLADEPREIRLRLGGSMMPYRWTINDQEYPQADPILLSIGEPVRFVLENPTGMDHPFHLHGHYFRVLGPPDQLNRKNPPEKDTVSVPAGGALVLEWNAINPGRWFFHCHIEWHAATGMARVIEIGPAAGA